MSKALDKYLKQLRRKLKTDNKTKEKILSDIRSDIEIHISNGKTVEEAINRLGSPTEVAEDFNASYPEYKSNKQKRLLSIFTVICGVVALICLIIGLTGRFICINSEQVSHIGGADLPTQIFVNPEPISELDIFNMLIKISLAIFIVVILCAVYFIFKFKRKGR